MTGGKLTKPLPGHWPDKIVRGLLYSLIVLIPAVFSTNLYTTFSAPKLVILHLITCIILLVWGGKTFALEQLEYKKSPLNISLFFYALIGIITTFTSVAFYSSIYGTYGRFIGIFTIINLILIVFLTANHFSKRQITKAILVSVFTSGILALYGIVQYFNYFQETFNWSADPSERVFGTLGHPNHFGVYLAINLMLGLGLVQNLKNRWIKALIYAGAILQLVTIFLTGSRSAIISLIMGATVFILLIAIKNWETLRLQISRYFLGTFIILALIGTGIIIYQQEVSQFPLIKRTADTFQNIGNGNLPDRISWWYSGLEMIKEKPLFGYGLSTFRDVYNQYRRTDYHTLEQNGMEYRITPETAHNEYINLAATQGIIGLIIFLTIIIFAYTTLISLYLSKKEQGVTAAGITSALTIFLVDVFFGFGVVATYFSLFFLLGITIAYTNKETKKSVRTIRLPHITKYIFALIIIIIPILGLSGTIRFTLSEYHYKEAVKAQYEGKRNDAIENFEKAIINKPDEFAFHQAFADYALNAVRGEQSIKKDLLDLAIEQYDRAIQINPNHPSAHFNLGTAYLQLYTISQNDYYLLCAEQNFERSVQLAVNNPLYTYSSGVALMGINTPDEQKLAREYFQKTRQIEPKYQDTEQLIQNISQPSQSQ